MLLAFPILVVRIKSKNLRIPGMAAWALVVFIVPL